LAALPDPRDYQAAERTELFEQVRKQTGCQDAQQMWMALGLAKPFGAGLRDSKRKHTPPGDPNDPAAVALDLWKPIIEALEREGLEEKSWKDLPHKELTRLKDTLRDLSRAITK
jgi:hypothetical protein